MPLLPKVDIWLAPTSPVFPDFKSTLDLFALWRSARAGEGGPGLFASAITQVGPNERDLEWAARRKLSFMGQDMLVLNQSLTRHPAWDVTYSGHAMHELPANVAGKAASEFSAMLGQLFAFGLLTLAAPLRFRTPHNGQPNSAALL